MASDSVQQLVFEGDRVVLGEFHCWPDDPRWSRENRAEEGHFVVFPGTSVVIERAGEAVVATPNHVMFYDRDQAYRRRLLHPRGDHCVFLLVDEALLAELAGGAARDSASRSVTARSSRPRTSSTGSSSARRRGEAPTGSSSRRRSAASSARRSRAACASPGPEAAVLSAPGRARRTPSSSRRRRS
ncbi:MAG: hypothetical protein ACRDOP_10250 [Gaiellaceae bacterium]